MLSANDLEMTPGARADKSSSPCYISMSSMKKFRISAKSVSAPLSVAEVARKYGASSREVASAREFVIRVVPSSRLSSALGKKGLRVTAKPSASLKRAVRTRGRAKPS